MRIAIHLTPAGYGCRVFLNDIDISRHLRGIELRAHVHERTRVSLDLLPTVVEVYGEAGEIVRLQQKEGKD